MARKKEKRGRFVGGGSGDGSVERVSTVPDPNGTRAERRAAKYPKGQPGVIIRGGRWNISGRTK